MRISQAAHRSGLEPSSIRFYEKAAVLPHAERDSSGYREYEEDDIELLRFVRRLRTLELPLDDVREIVELRGAGEAPCRPARELTAIDARITELERLRGELNRLSEAASDVVDDWPRECVCHVIETHK